ncbi:MAG TPA: IgGFc-binding protein [Polyangiaceae bacterium]|nr:IgGFc-binding protein [Polyangiaceae bacterium]
MRRVLGFAVVVFASCQFDRADRWVRDPLIDAEPVCVAGAIRCNGALERCDESGSAWRVEDDCPKQGLVCSKLLSRCAVCEPATTSCNGQTVEHCEADGRSKTKVKTCDAPGVACREGLCRDLCEYARKSRSNVGCEYWAADLDNAVADSGHNAAAQQFAIVLSNPQPDVAADIVIEQDDSELGEPARLRTVGEASILPLNLETFKLGPREVDGSPDGEFDTGTGTALTRHAYRIKARVPIVAYQFNPLENVNVFSNDASLLKPVEALTYAPGTMGLAYVAVGWPQTIAATDDPSTNFDPQNPTNLRAFLTIIGTRDNTHVRMKTKTRVIAGGPVAETAKDGIIEATLQPFEVLNLETGGANADFTSSTIDADQPVVVFSGSEASDAPPFDSLLFRSCCADHLEEQLDPVRTAGRTFVLAHSPSRTTAIKNAGGTIGVAQEPEYYRVVAVSEAGATVRTSLPPPNDTFRLEGRGAVRDLTTEDDVLLTSDGPIVVGDVQASQEAAFVPRGLPGGDPSLVIVPPVEQFRSDYVFLTPDKYAFDFVIVIAPPTAEVALDGQLIDGTRCNAADVTGYRVYRCQLSFPKIDPLVTTGPILTPGSQNDGVHRIVSNAPVGVLVFGWDAYVSYGYAAGTQLEQINDQVN